MRTLAMSNVLMADPGLREEMLLELVVRIRRAKGLQ